MRDDAKLKRNLRVDSGCLRDSRLPRLEILGMRDTTDLDLYGTRLPACRHSLSVKGSTDSALGSGFSGDVSGASLTTLDNDMSTVDVVPIGRLNILIPNICLNWKGRHQDQLSEDPDPS